MDLNLNRTSFASINVDNFETIKYNWIIDVRKLPAYFIFVQAGADAVVGRTIWGGLNLGVFGIKVKEVPAGKHIVTTSRSHSNKLVNDCISAMNVDEVIRVGGAGNKVCDGGVGGELWMSFLNFNDVQNQYQPCFSILTSSSPTSCYLMVLEMLQRRFMRMLPGMQNINFVAKLVAFPFLSPNFWGNYFFFLFNYLQQCSLMLLSMPLLSSWLL